MNCPECGSEVEDGFCRECEADRRLRQEHAWHLSRDSEGCVLCADEAEEVPA